MIGNRMPSSALIWEGKEWRECLCWGISSFLLTRHKHTRHISRHRQEKPRITRSIVAASGVVKARLHTGKEPKSQLVANTYLFLSADIADDRVWSRAGRGAEDGYHAFGHDLAHWGREKKGWGVGGGGMSMCRNANMSAFLTMIQQHWHHRRPRA